MQKQRKKLEGQAKCKTERIRFGNVIQRDDQKCDEFKIAKGMAKINENIIGEQSIRNEDGVISFEIGIISFRQTQLAVYLS